MKAQTFLYSIRNIKDELNAAKKSYSEALEIVTSITPNLEGVSTGGTKDPHKFDEVVAYAKEVEDIIKKLYRRKAVVHTAINMLPDTRHRAILIDYYLNGATWAQVCEDVNYSWSQVHRLHGRALQALQRVLDEHDIE